MLQGEREKSAFSGLSGEIRWLKGTDGSIFGCLKEGTHARRLEEGGGVPIHDFEGWGRFQS